MAEHDSPPTCHPSARPGAFQAELWKFDVAEFFLSDPRTGRYLEFNLAPNGAWWSCLFRAPLDRCHPEDEPLPGVRTETTARPTGWHAEATLPLTWLREQLHFGDNSRLNATFILNSPQQRFFTAVPLGGRDPAFHQPDSFSAITFVPRNGSNDLPGES